MFEGAIMMLAVTSGAPMRWTYRRKAELVDGLRAGTLTAAELQRRHGVSAEELTAWIRAYDADGPRGLRVAKPPPAIDRQIAQRDEWRAAKLLIRRHGDGAQVEAARIANLVGCGDEWKSRWARIRSGDRGAAITSPGQPALSGFYGESSVVTSFVGSGSVALRSKRLATSSKTFLAAGKRASRATARNLAASWR